MGYHLSVRGYAGPGAAFDRYSREGTPNPGPSGAQARSDLQSGLQQDQYDTGSRRRPGACSGVLYVYLMTLNHVYVLRFTQR